jgi:hypothetical protein
MELKAMLAKEVKIENDKNNKLNYQKTGGHKKTGKLNSNKMWDFK